MACFTWKLLFWQVSGQDIPPDLGYRDRHHPVCLTLPHADQMLKNRRKVDLRWVEGGQLTAMAVIRQPRNRLRMNWTSTSDRWCTC